ncbi:MAG: sodium:solute symporter family protein, partial [Clostridiales bacterium]|nr:sodium:solute symporter family protein [Clostridiales bacterium]
MIPFTSYLSMAIICLFMFVPLWLGGEASKKSIGTIEDFFILNRGLSTALAFFTIWATWWSSFAFLGSTAFFYARGPVYWTGIGWNVLFGLIYLLFGKRIWRHGKQNGCITPVDFFDEAYRFKPLSLLATLTMLVFTLLYLHLQLFGGSILIDIASGGIISWRVSGLIFCTVMIIYLWEGGMRAVAWADIFYGVLVFGSMLSCGFFLAHKAGGIGSMFMHIAETEPERLLLPGPFGSEGEMLWITMFIIIPLGAFMGPQVWLRVYSVKEERTFDVMPFLLSISTVAYVGSVLSGNAGAILHPEYTEQPEYIIAVLLIEHAPFWFMNIILCGAAAAALSTANSQIHAVSALVSINVYKKYINPKAAERNIVGVGKKTVVAFCLLAYLTLNNTPNMLVFSGLLALSGTAQLIVPAAGALFWRKSNAVAAFWGLASGLASLVLLFFFFGDKLFVYPGLLALLINTAVFVT